MKKILLACAGGFSTSMLVEKMKEEAQKRGLSVVIDATAQTAIDKEIDSISVVLLGPQMSHAEKGLKEKYGAKVPIAVIPMMDYGMMNGEKVLNQALELIENFEGGL
ncbi:MAG: PTS sugar transporter subunit IIB [Defluviitaleaceae bacterium]|nr:PTS sugar transporter subunit IIB [Defluviitaleaceae bacterium]